ncbi:MAG: hypothetical protein IT324_04815 [Anaerolineae bacterium]|nr:hypothetical protein [Anaerolineae bacterium]
MRLSPIITAVVALVALVIVGAAGALLIQPNRPLLANATFSLTRITPNADGLDDATTIHYTLNRNAKVTIAFTNKADNRRFVFRNAEERPSDAYQVLFSGVVDGYLLPGEDPKTIGGDIETRLIPNGDYTWTIDVVTDGGETASASGNLSVADADQALPLINDFSVSPQVFTPNQDGIDDRVQINAYLTKAATLTVYLEDRSQQRYYVAERIEGRKPGDPGGHMFDYDGGVDNDITPPPNGDYTVVAITQDKVGQRIRRTGTVTLADGGLPNAEIAAQSTGGSVHYSVMPYKDSYFTDAQTPGERVPMPQGVTSLDAQITIQQGDLLVFRLTVSNYGSTPIRTVGPWPGTVYQYDQKAAVMNRDAISGVWRVGLDCERTETSFPWRWAIGAQDGLTKIERNGETLWYLMPGQQAVVWGAVRITRLVKTRNPQECWAALIHEDVAIPPLQSHVGAIKIDVQGNESPESTATPGS